MSRHNTPTGKRAIYYYTNWSGYARNFQVKDIPADVVDIARRISRYVLGKGNATQVQKNVVFVEVVLK